MTDPSDQSSGFWTLTRPSKLSKRRNSDLHELHHKVFNISVVGLSGVERDKGPIGIGKSCLCNRFVRSAADEYHTDHISVLGQSDFSGRVVNNDHWLYWGSVIKSCDGYDLAFNIIEQSEFVDDACFQPFKSGKTEPYFKRCANTKLVSAEKLMYICKNQLGVEREYEQRYLPEGKFNVDGFLCLFDVSEVQGRNVDKQIEMTNLIMLNLIKTRKPIVFVTTKHDEASDLLVVEAERLVNQRDFRGLVPIVETSAQENVNINMAFLVCAQLIDKTRTKLRVPPYFEAHKNHSDLLNAASEAYLGLIRSTVIDYRSSWQQVCIKLSHNPEFLQYTYLHGLDKASLVFKSHLRRLRDECINQRVQTYLAMFPDILNELFPRNANNINNISNNNNNCPKGSANHITNAFTQTWESVKEQLRSHSSFNRYFVQTPAGISWFDTEILHSPDNRIPSDWLESEEAYLIFQQRSLILENEKKRLSTRELFAQMLANIKVPVGKPFVELKHIFANNPSLEILSDKELFDVYVDYQNNLLQQARADFQELLLENAEHLHHLTSSNKVIRQEDIKTINAILQHDERYQALDRFDQDRTLMMIRHLSFLHSQISEQCPSHPRCVEPEVERLLTTKAKTLVDRFFENKADNKSSTTNAESRGQKTCDLVIFGPRRPSQQLILALNVLNSRAPKSSQYQITFTVFDNADEVDTQIQRFRQSDTKPKGCFGIFTNQRSLDHVSYILEKFLILSSQIKKDKNHFGDPPVVMLYAADITLDERTMLALENEGQRMADRFKCPFMNVTAIDQYRQHQQSNILSNEQDSASQAMSECASLDYACVDAAFNVLKEAVSRRVCFMELYNNQDLIPRQAFHPDARILMCLLCGEPFSNELFMWKMFLDYEDCYVTSSNSICLKVKLDSGHEKFIGVTITSYTHGAFNYREDLLHGFMLVCSIQRRASISILNAFSFNIPCTPVLVMAVRSDVSFQNKDRLVKVHFEESEEEANTLINEAKSASNMLKGHFELLDLREDQSSGITDDAYNIRRIRNFLQNVIKRKPLIERAYELGDSDNPLPTSILESNDFLSSSSSKKPQDRANAQDTKNVSHQFRAAKQASTLSSDDDIVNDAPQAPPEEKKSCSVVASPTPPKPVRFTKTDKREESHSIMNELYATRPLPPIPSAVDRRESDRDFEQSSTIAATKAISLSGNHHKLFDGSLKQQPHYMQASEETNDSSSDNDTEDSIDNKHDKPKPGKLDLSQFDNITNAIGKLNVQPPIKLTESNSSGSTHSKMSTSQVLTENSQETGFFKNRAKKAKSRPKESLQRESGSDDKLASFITRDRHYKIKGSSGSSDINSQVVISSNQESRKLDQICRIQVTPKSKIGVLQRKLSDLCGDDVQSVSKRGQIKEISSRFSRNDVKSGFQVTPASSFMNASQDASPFNLDINLAERRKTEKDLPRPAPRSTHSNLTRTTNTPVVSTLAMNPAISSTTTAKAAVTGTKRIQNPRQNHGRAVAPPQLPSDLGSAPTSSLVDKLDSDFIDEHPSNETVMQLTNDESGIDFSQSPIAQRLLKQYKDHKVSELNSPYESDCEQAQNSLNVLREPRVYRGQSLESENNSPCSLFTNSSIDSTELINSRGAAIKQLNEILANKQLTGRPGGPKHLSNRSSSLDQEHTQQQQQQSLQSASGKKNDKDSKKDKKKLRNDEKLEKRRLKEEERLRRQEKKLAAKKSKATGPEATGGSVGDDGVPFFIKKCIEFIEYEGLDAEGIYRVPGNRAHVDAFVQKFKENPDMSIVESDIPVNAVATALKDFLSKKWGPIIPLNLMTELTELSNICEKEQRVQAVRKLVKKLPSTNYKLLKYVFSHFVKVSLNHSLNSMDSKNLAICWWPTLLPLHFSDMVMFEQMRPHLEESIQTMIDQYDFIFDGEEPDSTVT